jgi:hypothetical protein
MGIDLYWNDKCQRTVITGIKPNKLGEEIAYKLNMVIQAGRLSL